MPEPTRKRLSREESRAQTRSGLLDAARSLFARQGFEGTSVEQIAEAAGYTRGAFYSNFDDKEALLITLIQRCFDEDLHQLATLNATSLPDAGAELRHATTAERQRESHLLTMEFWMCALRYPAVRTAYDSQHARLRAVIGQFIAGQYERAGRPVPAPPEQLAAVAIALRNGLDTQRLISPAAVDPDLYRLSLQLLVGGTPEADAP